MTSIRRWFAALAIVMLALPAGAGADTSSRQATDPRQATGEPAGEDELEEDEEPDCE